MWRVVRISLAMRSGAPRMTAQTSATSTQWPWKRPSHLAVSSWHSWYALGWLVIGACRGWAAHHGRRALLAQAQEPAVLVDITSPQLRGRRPLHWLASTWHAFHTMAYGNEVAPDSRDQLDGDDFESFLRSYHQRVDEGKAVLPSCALGCVWVGAWLWRRRCLTHGAHPSLPRRCQWRGRH